MYAVYNSSGTIIKTITTSEGPADGNGQYTRTGAFSGGLTDKVTMTLAKGQEYTVLFWAQDADCEAYTTTDLEAVKIDYSGINNDETRDAFYAAKSFKVTQSTSMDVVLYRPFAQVNVGVTDADWEAAVASEITVSKSAVTFSDVADVIDLSTGKVSQSSGFTGSISYTTETIPSETLSVDVNGDGTIADSEKYHWLSMSYILVNDTTTGAASALTDSKFTFSPTADEGVTLGDIDLDVTSVPVQRNYRTNILGKILSGDIEFDIVIDKEYDEPDYLVYPSATAAELMLAATNGGTVTLAEDVELTEPLHIAAGVSVVINLDGNDIISSLASGDEVATADKDRTIVVEDGAELIINGEGNVYANYEKYEDSIVIGVKGGSLIINGGTYYGGIEGCIYLFNSDRYDSVENDGSIVINGGYFNVTGTPSYNSDWYYVLNVQNGAPGTISVTGGTFENYDPAKGDDTGTPSTFLADGYKSVKVSNDPSPYGTYMVVAEDVSVATSSDELATALADNSVEQIALSTDMTVSETLTISSDKEIDLNGKTLTVSEIDVADGQSITISDGELASTFRSGDGVEITLDEVTLTTPSSSGTGIELGSPSTRGGNGTLTMTNSTIDVTAYSGSATGIIIQGAGNKVVLENTTITHTYMGITQNGTTPGSDITLNNVTISGPKHGVYLSNNASGAANTLTVTGGSIHSEDATPIEVKKTTLIVDGATLSTNATWQGYFFAGDGACSLGFGIVLAGHTDGVAYDTVTCPYTLSNITYLRPNVVADGTYYTEDTLFNAGVYNGYSRTKTADRAYKSLDTITDDGAVE